MKRFARVLRYSGLGVFVTGIGTVLAGCSEREGILGFVLLLLLQNCSAPMEQAPAPPPTLSIGSDLALFAPPFSAISNFTCILDDTPANIDGTVSTVDVHLTDVTNGESFSIKIFRPDGGGDYDFISEHNQTVDAAMEAMGDGQFTLPVSLDVLAGDVIGIYTEVTLLFTFDVIAGGPSSQCVAGNINAGKFGAPLFGASSVFLSGK